MKRFEIGVPSASAARQMLTIGDVRFTVLTPRLLRVETGAFCDEPTQRVWRRAFDAPTFERGQSGNVVEIVTADTRFVYDVGKRKMTEIVLKDGRRVRNFRKGNLKGTRRTLDGCDGAVPLEDGLVSRGGVAVMDDSDGLILRGDKIVQRPPCRDLYFFAYGSDYRGCIADFFKLCGDVPLLPRYALGNWWSRYKAYTQQEYLDLMRRFKREKLPITIATIDMDWHWVDVVGKFGEEARPRVSLGAIDRMYNTRMPGWTGYSWNTDLFPDHKAMFRELKEMGYRITLNVHPAQGIRFFEDMYPEVAKTVGVDPATRAQIPFSLADENYIKAYFDDVHRPYEREGVDFWWIDWQQGKRSDVPGLDPLWALNHYHTLDQADEGKRPLILSRYAKEGSHRYPVGFSGDSFMTWRSLKFQPYMTATAANVGYTWWSHDIGGHQWGIKDDELYVRWLQFGVFSPINRLHSTSNEFMGKEPWKCTRLGESAADEFLRLRHRLIPYLYSENHATHTEGRALCEPMYYGYDVPEAYEAKTQYMFGKNLLVSPIVRPSDRRTALAWADVWLPEGEWTDIFTGNRYKAGKYRVFRPLHQMPVFAKEGAIVPMYASGDDNGLQPDRALCIKVFRGSGEYDLYEDDGLSMDYRGGAFVITHMSVSTDGDRLTFKLEPGGGDLSMLPEDRSWTLDFADIAEAEVAVDGMPIGKLSDGVCVKYAGTPLTVTLTACAFKRNADYRESVIETVSRYRMTNMRKLTTFRRVPDVRDCRLPLSQALRGPIEELRRICE